MGKETVQGSRRGQNWQTGKGTTVVDNVYIEKKKTKND